MSADASLQLLLRELGLGLFEAQFATTIERAEQENWGYKRFLHYLAELECAARVSRRVERYLKDSGLPPVARLDRLDPALMPEKARRMLPSLQSGDWVKRGDNLLLFGLPGRGKTAYGAALARSLIQAHELRVRFVPTFKLVSELLAAKRDLRLPEALARLNRYPLIILDDLGYAKHDREEMDVLFNFLAERYEKQLSLILTSNLVFSEWDKVFKDAMTAQAAVDRLIHRAVVLEFTGESIRRTQAQERNDGL